MPDLPRDYGEDIKKNAPSEEWKKAHSINLTDDDISIINKQIQDEENERRNSNNHKE
jgi:hypothetical protein